MSKYAAWRTNTKNNFSYKTNLGSHYQTFASNFVVKHFSSNSPPIALRAISSNLFDKHFSAQFKNRSLTNSVWWKMFDKQINDKNVW